MRNLPTSSSIFKDNSVGKSHTIAHQLFLKNSRVFIGLAIMDYKIFYYAL